MDINATQNGQTTLLAPDNTSKYIDILDSVVDDFGLSGLLGAKFTLPDVRNFAASLESGLISHKESNRHL